MASAADPLVHAAFNSDATHFVAATSSGIRIFSCSPLEHVFSRSGFGSAAGEVTAADVVLPAGPQLVAVVFGDTIRYCSERHGQMMMSAATTLHGPVRAVRHVGNLVLVASEDRVTLHERSSVVYAGVVKKPKHVMEVDTGPNPRGACALAQRDGGFVLACPSPAGARTEVQVWHGASGPRVVVKPRGRLRDVACVELSRDARLLAAADSLGMFLCIFSTSDGMILQQLNMRGAIAEICCIAFSSDSKWLAVSSDQGVNLFCVRVDFTPWTPVRDPDDPSDAELMDPHTRAFFVTSFTIAMPVARFRLVRGVRYVAVAFDEETKTILTISMSGSLYRCEFDPVKDHMKQVEHMDLTEMKWRLLQ